MLIIYTPFYKKKIPIDIINNEISIPELPQKSLSYIAFQINSKNQDKISLDNKSYKIDLEVDFMYSEKKLSANKTIEFLLPLKLQMKLLQHLNSFYLIIEIENCVKSDINILNVQLNNCKIYKELQVLPCHIIEGQVLHLAYIIEKIEDFFLTVSFSRHLYNKSLEDIIDWAIDYTTFGRVFEYTYRIHLNTSANIDSQTYIKESEYSLWHLDSTIYQNDRRKDKSLIKEKLSESQNFHAKKQII